MEGSRGPPPLDRRARGGLRLLPGRRGRFGDAASIVAASDGTLLVWANGGDLSLVEGASRYPDRLVELTRLDGLGSGMAWPHLVLGDGALLAKDRSGRVEAFDLAR